MPKTFNFNYPLSVLGATNPIFNIGLIISGILLFVHANNLKKKGLLKNGATWFQVSGICLALMGFFPLASSTLMMHNILAGGFFLSTILGLYTLAKELKNKDKHLAKMANRFTILSLLSLLLPLGPIGPTAIAEAFPILSLSSFAVATNSKM